MAHTVTTDGTVCHILIDHNDSSDIAFSSMFTATERELLGIKSVQFNPGAADEILVLKNGSASAPIMFKVKGASVYDQRKTDYYNAKVRPYLDFSACSFSTDLAEIIIIAERRSRG